MTTVVFHGTIIHSLSISELRIIENGTLVVREGKIIRLEENKPLQDIVSDLPVDTKVHELGAHEFLMPGFVDTHAHAPQYVFAGSGMDLELLEWLSTHVFPAETRFQSVDYAEQAYTTVVKRFLRHGTTTCSWFATIHLESCKRLVNVIDRLGQRALVGKVNMDQNSPATYVESSTEQSLADTRDFIEYTLPKSLVQPVVTPRFAISCSSDLMHGLAKMAEEYQLPIQTHLCENLNEIKFTQQLFGMDYVDIYKHHGLLTPRSYFAHCVHMSDKDIDLLQAHGCGVAHCANSNISLQSGLCDVRRYTSRGMKIGLGTDVAGGYSPSILDAIRSSFFVSKTLTVLHRDGFLAPTEYTPLGLTELIYLATLGGAQVLGLDKVTGNFEVGKALDALWIRLDERGSVDVFDQDTPRLRVEKFVFNGSSENIAHVYVEGRRVAGCSDN